MRAVHSPFTAFLSNPITAFVLFVGSLYVVYFTPLFDTLVRYHWGHEFMALHFLITGYLFYWGIIGVDPGPRRLPFIGRLALLFAIMPFHAFFGIAMMTMESTVGGNFYRGLALSWVPNVNADQHLGGAIAWGASEVPLVIVVIALVTQWARQDRRAVGSLRPSQRCRLRRRPGCLQQHASRVGPSAQQRVVAFLGQGGLHLVVGERLGGLNVDRRGALGVQVDRHALDAGQVAQCAGDVLDTTLAAQSGDGKYLGHNVFHPFGARLSRPKFRSRKLLETTKKDEKAIAAPAISGLSRPATAIGMAAML